MRILVTGGCGFIGHHFVEHVLKNTDWDVVVLDALTYASSGFDRLRDIGAWNEKRVRIVGADISRPLPDGVVSEIGQVDYAVHMAAETHVDRSIQDARPFVSSNVMGTLTMLDWARRQEKLRAFLYFSTDEVFGPAYNGHAYGEWERYCSSNPYAASKAGGEEMALAYKNTHHVPVIITHTMNVFGERQHPEKFIPMCVRRIQAGEKIQIHADKTRTVPGSRCWIHARNVASAVLLLLEHYQESVGDKWNIAGEERSNLDVAAVIAHTLCAPLVHELVDFHSSRPGHDLRYALDGGKILQRFGWAPPVGLVNSLVKCVDWMTKPENGRWLAL